MFKTLEEVSSMESKIIPFMRKVEIGADDLSTWMAHLLSKAQLKSFANESSNVGRAVLYERPKYDVKSHKYYLI